MKEAGGYEGYRDHPLGGGGLKHRNLRRPQAAGNCTANHCHARSAPKLVLPARSYDAAVTGGHTGLPSFPGLSPPTLGGVRFAFKHSSTCVGDDRFDLGVRKHVMRRRVETEGRKEDTAGTSLDG